MKACLILGPTFSTTYTEVIKLFQEKDIRGGYTTIYYYVDDQGNTIRVGECFWYTTLMTDRSKMERQLELTKVYTPEEYPEFDDYPAIEVSRVKDIPISYEGLMGVPTTVVLRGNGDYDYDIVDGPIRPKLNGKTKFPRLIIRRKQK